MTLRTLKGATRRIRFFQLISVYLCQYRLTNSDQIWHGNPSRGWMWVGHSHNLMGEAQRFQILWPSDARYYMWILSMCVSVETVVSSNLFTMAFSPSVRAIILVLLSRKSVTKFWQQHPEPPEISGDIFVAKRQGLYTLIFITSVGSRVVVWQLRYNLYQGGYVFISVCLFVCLSVNRIA